MSKSEYKPLIPPRHPWGGRTLYPSEIEVEQATCAAMVKNMPKWKVLDQIAYRAMNRSYIRALKKGDSIESAELTAAAVSGQFSGLFLGVFCTLLAVGTISWFAGLVRTAGIIQASLLGLVWIVAFCWGLDKTRKWAIKKWSALVDRIFKRKKKEEVS